MKKFRLKTYTWQHKLRVAIISDMHLQLKGDDYSPLISVLKKEKPDMILVVGDMFVSRGRVPFRDMIYLFRDMAGIAPVYYSMGNHEKSAKEYQENPEIFSRYLRILDRLGINIFTEENQNTPAVFRKDGQTYYIHGLDIALEYYRKPFAPELEYYELTRMLGEKSPDGIHILMAHNPGFGDLYFRWGADLIISGHYHGGMVRFSEHIGACSPQFRIFPRYCCGHFIKDGKHMIVSAGMGEHTIPIRINNPRELIMLTH